jgi:hypothetical protein
MITLEFPVLVFGSPMSCESDPEIQSLQIETCTRKSIVKTTIQSMANFEFIQPLFIQPLNMIFGHSKATIVLIYGGASVRNW